jgi:hypothetical protein
MRYASAAGNNGKKFSNVVRLKFALELKEQLAQTLTAFVTSILIWPRRRLDTESAAELPLRQTIEVLE